MEPEKTNKPAETQDTAAKRDDTSWVESTGHKIGIEQVGRYLAGDLSPSEKADFVKQVRKDPELHDKILALELALTLDTGRSDEKPSQGRSV